MYIYIYIYKYIYIFIYLFIQVPSIIITLSPVILITQSTE